MTIQLLRWASLAAALFAASLSFAIEAKSQRPNILVIVTDDQSPFGLPIYEPDSILETPTLDKLAAEGTVLDAAYHMGAWAGDVCTPSRHMIMSGRTVWHVPDKRTPGRSYHAGDATKVPPNLAENTLAAVFNRAGYVTMRTCKSGNSYTAANEKFNVRHEQSCRGGQEPSSTWHADRVLDFLQTRGATGGDKPFLIYLGFSHPHDPRNGPPGLLKKYGAINQRDLSHPGFGDMPNATPALVANYLPQHPFPHGHPNLRDELAVEGVGPHRDPLTVRNELGREFACIEAIDTQIARVLQALEESGEREDTVIVFTSDHGIACGRHGLMGKQNLYEHSWRVPMIVSGPGVKRSHRAPGNVYLTDLLATLCDFAGITPPDTNEGASFRPVLKGVKSQIRDVVYGVYCGGTKPGIRAVRKGDWKLVKYDVLNGAVRKTQLFNLADNPLELLEQHHHPKVVKAVGVAPQAHQRNLANDPQFVDQLAKMEQLLLEQQAAFDDPYRLKD